MYALCKYLWLNRLISARIEYLNLKVEDSHLLHWPVPMLVSFSLSSCLTHISLKEIRNTHEVSVLNGLSRDSVRDTDCEQDEIKIERKERKRKNAKALLQHTFKFQKDSKR